LANVQPLLSVRDLTVRKGKTTLLESVSFTSQYGELKGVFGPSGAGKTTLLHAIAGVLDPALEVSGEIVVGGMDISNRSAEQRSLAGLAIVLQGLHLFPDLTVLDNVCYPLQHRGWTRGKAREKTMQILNGLHIQELANRAIGQLSGGQQQRVALARALIYGPSLLLLDEPFKGLEQELREQLLADICVQVQTGIGVLMVTHEKKDLRLAANSLIEIRKGRLIRAEERRDDSAHGGFETTADAVLLPASDDGSFVRARLINISRNGTGEHRGSSRALVMRAQVLESRRSSSVQIALLLKYESGQVGFVEFEPTHVRTLQTGEWINLEYSLSSEEEKKYA